MPPAVAGPRIAMLLERMELTACADDLVEKFSTGMRQRVAIARTLLPLPAEIALLLGFMVALLALGWAAFTLLERRVRQRGTLGQH